MVGLQRNHEFEIILIEDVVAKQISIPAFGFKLL
jgi:hypothetical protein